MRGRSSLQRRSGERTSRKSKMRSLFERRGASTSHYSLSMSTRTAGARAVGCFDCAPLHWLAPASTPASPSFRLPRKPTELLLAFSSLPVLLPSRQSRTHALRIKTQRNEQRWRKFASWGVFSSPFSVSHSALTHFHLRRTSQSWRRSWSGRRGTSPLPSQYLLRPPNPVFPSFQYDDGSGRGYFSRPSTADTVRPSRDYFCAVETPSDEPVQLAEPKRCVVRLPFLLLDDTDAFSIQQTAHLRSRQHPLRSLRLWRRRPPVPQDIRQIRDEPRHSLQPRALDVQRTPVRHRSPVSEWRGQGESTSRISLRDRT